MTRAHMANVLEQRFVSRIYDRRRALRGRSPAQAALDHALPLGDGADGIEVADVRAEIDKLVMLRMDLRSLGQVIGELTPDQRLVLVSLADSGIGVRRVLRALRLVQGEVPQGLPARPGAAARAAGGVRRNFSAPHVPFGRRRSERETGNSYEHHSPHS